ncbi:MAG: PQQ-dependent sugar dehydrogenase [Hydrogenovibrio sp.]|uniref:PQQ-dependent sugar dehydrogenase n=1 Tax=Hydrogenovibrio sp. TaxID=2065821 RepID=UPI0028709E21|nr:PQQ-dependent sugar dehydrogenase [Hydrogenovibrio sp.]MDR9497763.1 PQQ-dependent sugar dehydrogenase [Hydrogenovibrio sp.]
MTRFYWLWGVLSAFLWLATPVQSLADSENLTLETVAEDLDITWGMAFLDDRRLILTQREGRAGILDLSTQKIVWLDGVPDVLAVGQGGLLDVKLSPDYAQSGWVYVTYSKPKGTSGVTTLARARLNGQRLSDWQDLLVTQSDSYRNIHFGSRIAFDHQGHVFFTVGDRGQRENAQDLSNHAGTVIRLNLDGSVPEDNPFVSDPDALDEIWSYGHRNPQGLMFDRETNRLWEIEHGPQGGDEINVIEKGQNYGWPEVSQGKEYVLGTEIGVDYKAGMVDPVKVYTPSIAPSDLLIYRGQKLAAWQGDLFTGALALTHLNRVVLGADQTVEEEKRYLDDKEERVRSLAESPDGFLYLATDAGKIYRISAVPSD